jgi:hypothetical protein
LSVRRFSIVLSLAALAAWTSAAGQGEEELSAQRERWTANAGDGSYRYGYRKYCDCNRETPPETVVTVERGAITRVYHLHTDSEREVPAREGSLDLYWTIDGLFDLVATALESEATVRVRYDAELGYPTLIYVDYDPGFVGDELDLRLTRLELSR